MTSAAPYESIESIVVPPDEEPFEYATFKDDELALVMEAIDQFVARSHSAEGRAAAAKFSDEQEAVLADPSFIERLHKSVSGW